MEILRLFLENFSCHKNSFINFQEFQKAVIVGKILDNLSYSNGTGKSSIFQAIEYVLFNESEESLEDIIRDGTEKCTVTLDIKVDDKIYRIQRSRNRKGNSDLSLYLKNKDGIDENDGLPTNINYVDKSSTRATDTEKEINKLIKITYSVFRSTVHFVQNDFHGLATTTPEKRKQILKDALQLQIYKKLEKTSKDEFSSLQKKVAILEDQLNNLIIVDSKELEDKKTILVNSLELTKKSISENKEIKFSIQKEISKLEKIVEVLFKENTIKEEKKNSLIKEGNFYSSQIKEAEVKKSKIDVDKTKKEINSIFLKIKDIKIDQTDFTSIIQNNNKKIIETKTKINDLEKDINKYNKQLNSNLSTEECPTCGEIKSINDREKDKVRKQELINDLTISLNNYKKIVKEIEIENENTQLLIEQNNKRKEYVAKGNKEIEIKQSILDTADKNISEITEHISNLQNKVEELRKEFKTIKIDSSALDDFKNKLSEQQNLLLEQDNKLKILEKQFFFENSNLSILEKEILTNNENINKKSIILKDKNELVKDSSIYPYVTEAFSSYGIPTMIVQDLLQELQDEANKIMEKIKPGLQLSFILDKKNSKGEVEDVLDIEYFVQGNRRKFGKLSGAMKLTAHFSLKLGLSFLLQRLLGISFPVLLLDEIDQALDKASVETFLDIVSIFSKDCKILVITHNDTVKDFFENKIIVDQNADMISTVHQI